jgi:NADH dehydrogenase [ubiquinone] 1 alpha subcomplex assembly factor 7
VTRLAERLAAEIAADGPISVADYMNRCLHDPQNGYYATRPALGADGDFITAPMVSQMFGELIGLWAVETWRRLGAPNPFYLVELGPGEGVMISDALRAAKLDPAFVAAGRLHLVETSDPLIKSQLLSLRDAPLRPEWTARVDDLPNDAPMILVANEFLDCLPVRQFLRTDRGWAERRVGLSDEGDLAWGLQPAVKPDAAPDDAEPGAIWEVSDTQTALGAELGERVARQGGVALLIDYGRDAPGPGDTLQALSQHRKVDFLADPGSADLTVWADFPAVLSAARAHAATSAVVPQGVFLERLGIRERAAALIAGRPDRAETIARQLARLTDPDEMGTLFKACAIHPQGFVPPGFEDTL